MNSKYNNPQLKTGDKLYCDPLGFGFVLSTEFDLPTEHEKAMLVGMGKGELKTVNRAKIHWIGGAELPETTSVHCVEAMKWGKEGLMIVGRKP